MNSPTSKFVAAVRNAVLTISLTTVLSIAVLVAAKRKKEGKTPRPQHQLKQEMQDGKMTSQNGPVIAKVERM